MIALIPARGGSKGLPGKNLKLLNGKPLIAYTIEAALQSKCIDRVIVSTDDQEIAEVAKEWGAEIPFMRPDFLASDTAHAVDVYKYTLNKLEELSGNQVDEFIVLQPTSPLRNSNHIDEAIELFQIKNADSVISYCEEQHPVFWHKYITDEGKFEELFEGDFNKNRQEMKPTYYPNGSIYIFKKNLILNNKYQSMNSYAYLMDRKFSVDIDTIEDFNYCAYLIKNNI